MRRNSKCTPQIITTWVDKDGGGVNSSAKIQFDSANIKIVKKKLLYSHIFMYFHGTLTQLSVGRVVHVTQIGVGSKVLLGSFGSLTFWLKFWKKKHCTPVHFLGSLI